MQFSSWGLKGDKVKNGNCKVYLGMFIIHFAPAPPIDFYFDFLHVDTILAPLRGNMPKPAHDLFEWTDVWEVSLY